MANKTKRGEKTQVIADEGISPAEKVSKSFVLRKGELSRLAKQLVADIRRVMEPNTAIRLKETKKNTLKDFIRAANLTNVTHLLLLSQTESNTNLRIARLPHGPTIHLRILSYALISDILATQKRPHSPGAEYLTPPLLVLSNFDMDRPHHKLLCTLLQNMFPSINASTAKLANIRRVLLFHYDADNDSVQLRHYLITVKAIGMSKSVKRLLDADRIPDLGNFADAADFVLRAEANLSESEMEPDSIVTLDQDYPSKARGKRPSYASSSRRSVNLVEIGPRMSLRLFKITEGMPDGKVLYHLPARKDRESAPSQDAR